MKVRGQMSWRISGGRRLKGKGEIGWTGDVSGWRVGGFGGGCERSRKRGSTVEFCIVE